MSMYLTVENSRTPFLGLVGYCQSILARLQARWEYHRTYQKTVDELETYSDRHLADLGFARHDIPGVVKRAMESSQK